MLMYSGQFLNVFACPTEKLSLIKADLFCVQFCWLLRDTKYQEYKKRIAAPLVVAAREENKQKNTYNY